MGEKVADLLRRGRETRGCEVEAGDTNDGGTWVSIDTWPFELSVTLSDGGAEVYLAARARAGSIEDLFYAIAKAAISVVSK